MRSGIRRGKRNFNSKRHIPFSKRLKLSVLRMISRVIRFMLKNVTMYRIGVILAYGIPAILLLNL